MLLLLFELGSDRYAVDVRQVAEILPMVTLTRMPQALGAIAGLLNYRGVPIPVLDLSRLILGRAAELREAIAHYRKALYLEPTHADALIHLALLIEAQGDLAGARILRNRARRLETQSGALA